MLHPLVKVVDSGVMEGKGMVAIGLIHAGEVISRLEPNQPMTPLVEFYTWSQEQQDECLIHSYQCSETHLVSEDGDEKYMNHSCDPNTWWVDDETMLARRDILPGEEITYDYSTTEVAVPLEMHCLCGSPLCRGMVTNRDHLIPEWQQRFGSYLPRHTLKAIKEAQSQVKA
jgi:hypothetical protein